MAELRLGSLFDGSGGFPLAGAINGIEPVWSSEIEPYPLRVTAARFPQVKQLGDVTKIKGDEIEPVDIITFGSPCQDLSVAGKQAGIHDGQRSNLFFEAIRIIKEMRHRDELDGRTGLDIRPRFAVWENVPGAFSSNKGEDFRAVLEAFAGVCEDGLSIPQPKKWDHAGCMVGHGWSVAWRVYDAQYWGVPQRRKRIYLIADFGTERAGEILFEREGVPGDHEQGGEARQGTTGDAAGGAGVRDQKCLNPWDVQSKHVMTPDGTSESLCAGEKRWGALPPNVCYESDETIAFQLSGDRDNPSVSTSDKAYCIPANPMSDRGQSVCYPEIARSLTYRHDSSPCVDRGQNVCCYTADGVHCLNPWDSQTIRQYDVDGVSPALTSNERGGQDRHGVVYCLQGNGIDRADTAGCNGCGYRKDESYTLNTIDRPAVAYQPKVFDNHSHDSRYKGPVEATQTVSATFGMGGNNTPLCVEENDGVCALTNRGYPQGGATETLRAGCHQALPIVCIKGERDE